MALRRPRQDEMAAPTGGTATALATPPDLTGESVDECNAVGELLVQANQIAPDQVADALDVANGDLIKLSNTLLQRFGVARAAVSEAVARACQVPVADPTTVTLDEEMIAKFPKRWPALTR